MSKDFACILTKILASYVATALWIISTVVYLASERGEKKYEAVVAL